MATMGQRIRKLREDNNMTQAQLADLLKIKTYTTISKWESDDNQPRHELLVKLTEIFQVSMDYLFVLEDRLPANTQNKIDNKTSEEILEGTAEATSKLQTDEFPNENLEKSSEELILEELENTSDEDDEIEDDPLELSKKQQKLLEDFNQLKKKRQKKVLNFIEDQLKKQK